MTKILGANWPTTLSGGLFTVAIGITADPHLIAFLPASWQGSTQGICGLIALLSGGAFAYQAKSKNVTGGTVQQTADGAVAATPLSASTSVIETVKADPK